MNPIPVIDAIISAPADLPGAVLQINMHDKLFEPANHWYGPAKPTSVVERQKSSRSRSSPPQD